MVSCIRMVDLRWSQWLEDFQIVIWAKNCGPAVVWTTLWPKSRKLQERREASTNKKHGNVSCNIAARKQLKTLSYADQNSHHTGFCWVHLSTRWSGFLGTMFLNRGLSSVWFAVVIYDQPSTYTAEWIMHLVRLIWQAAWYLSFTMDGRCVKGNSMVHRSNPERSLQQHSMYQAIVEWWFMVRVFNPRNPLWKGIVWGDD